ncbi:MAG: HDOD domain-containing protein [Spirochaetales bacterium]|nr:HDOD domain-containing protein [Spirochaetales bacterium]
MDERKVLIIRNYIEKMPSLPTTVSRILEICNSPQTSPTDLNKVISLDPVLMGKVLKLINSAYYGISQEITSLVRAIIMLGINTVKNLALSTAVLGTLGKKSDFQALNMDGFWRHSLAVGVTAKLIAKSRKIDPRKLEDYFVAGLLHDIGKIPLNNRFSDEYIMAMSFSDRDRMSLNRAETMAMGMDHGDVGRMIIESWKLDDNIMGVVAFHHRPEEFTGTDKELLYSVILANYFVNAYEIGFSGNRYPQKPGPEVIDALGFSMEMLEDMEDIVIQEIKKASIFLKLAE